MQDDATPALSSQQRLLETELKLANRTDRSRAGCLQMLDGLEERIAVGTVWRRFPVAEPNPNCVQAPTQSLEQMVDRLQRHRRFDLMESRPDGMACQQGDQQMSQDCGRDGMARQNSFQEDRAGAATTSAFAAIGAVDPLAADLAFVGLGRVIAVKQAVPVQRLGCTAVATAMLLERKTPTLSASMLLMNRGMGMAKLVPSRAVAVQTSDSNDGAANGGTQLDEG